MYFKATRDGSFECRARNAAGAVTKKIKVRVIKQAPTFVNELPRVIDIERGSSALLDCAASGIPKPM